MINQEYITLKGPTFNQLVFQWDHINIKADVLPHSDGEEEKKAQPHACLIFTPHTINKAFQEQNTQKEKSCLLMQPGTVICKANRPAFKAVAAYY